MSDEPQRQCAPIEILIVDNDPRLSDLMALLLQKSGYRTRTAHDFTAAREELRRSVPDLMLSDLELGAERGDEELARLDAEGALPPTLVVSGFLDNELDARLRALPGVVGTLRKPFDFAVLDARIRAALALVRERRAAASAVRGDVATRGEEGDGWLELSPAYARRDHGSDRAQ